MQIKIELDEAPLRRLEEVFKDFPAQAAMAQSGAINRTAEGIRTEIGKVIYAELYLKKTDILKRIALRKGSPEKPGASIKIDREPVPLGKYQVKQTMIGVEARVRKGGRVENYAHSFIAVMKSGHKGVFERRKIGGKRVPRLPVNQRYGPTVVGVLAGKPGMLKRIMELAQERLVKNVQSQISRFLGTK